MMPTLAYNWMNSVDDASYMPRLASSTLFIQLYARVGIINTIHPVICQGWHHQHHSSSYMPGLASSTLFIQLYARVGIMAYSWMNSVDDANPGI
jgi:hypothetical protein